MFSDQALPVYRFGGSSTCPSSGKEILGVIHKQKRSLGLGSNCMIVRVHIF
jgi:hypothetical protein